MPYRMNPQQFQSVLALSAEARATHFVSKVAGWEELWSVRSDRGWILREPPSGSVYAQVWPHPAYAEAVVEANYPDGFVRRLSLDEFQGNTLQLFAVNDILIGVFPDLNGTTWIMTPAALDEWLGNEAAQYE